MTRSDLGHSSKTSVSSNKLEIILEETILKPLVSYYGGKQRLAPKLIPLIPPHSVYVEPFAGGAALLFAKGRPETTGSDHYREILNDKNALIANLYQVARERPAELKHLLDHTLYSSAEHRSATNICKGLVPATELQKAWAVYVALQFSTCNTIGSGICFQTVGRVHPDTHQNYLLTLPASCERLKRVFIECRDALEIVKKWDTPQTFFYCDPPYPGSDQGHYNGYSTKEFNALVEALENCQGAYILSCYDAEGLRAPRDAERIEFKATCTAARKGDRERIEVVYRREAKGSPRPGLKLFTGADMVSSNK